MPDEARQYQYALLGIAVALVLLFSLLVVQQILLGVTVAVWIAILYLLWRFVRAHERIATALEAER